MRGKSAITGKRKLAICTATIALFLAGCERQTTPEPESAEVTEPETPSVEEIEVPTNSILRNDMDDRPIAAPPLEPLEVTIPFGEGGSELSNEAKTVLSEIMATEQFKGDGTIILRGHTDSTGYDEANIRASKKRAQLIADIFEDSGVNPDRITIIGMGEQNPIAPNALPDGSPDEDGRARNRRVDVTIDPPDDDAENAAADAADPDTSAEGASQSESPAAQ